MQSVRAGAVQTYFLISTCFLKSRPNKISFGPHFGDDFRQKRNIWVKKCLHKKYFKKAVQAPSNDTLFPSPGASGQPPLSQRFLEQEQLSEQETITAAHFWVHFWAVVLKWVIFVQSLSDFRFKVTIHFRLVVPMRAHGWWSDTP